MEKMKKVKTQYNPQELESRIREFWEKNDIVKKVGKFQTGRKKFYLLDGPPYVNQVAHVGHVKTTTTKDIWGKFKKMQGFNVWFQPGFDCHGLPIENMVEKELGIKSKKEIEEMGIEKFCEACKHHAEDKRDEWLHLYKLLGAWRGWFDPYLTYKNYYIESGWWTIKKLYEKGMLVEGEKSTFWCSHCGTALAGYEVTDSYADVKDPSIYVKFPVKGKDREYLVIMTTTPWTLVSNVAIGVHPDEYYVKVKVNNEILILAENAVERVLRELCKLDYEVIEKFLGKELEGLKYEPVLDTPTQQKLKGEENAHQIILSIPVMKRDQFEDFVTTEEGSGLVHTAPGHGPEDHAVGLHYNLPVVSPVDDEGKFTEDAGEFGGLFVKDADKLIVEKLEKKGLLLHFGWLVHSYPLCWRCKSPLIHRLTKQWFLKIDTIKEKMIKENKKVRWLPRWGQERFHNWLIGAVDWCISRQRYWGIPLPVWICKKCGSKEVIGSVDELRKKSVKKLPKSLDLHRHVVDKIELKCKNCGFAMRRVLDTMDVWYDSGIAPWASLGYPFKNKELFETLWETDIICESQDQIRGWFYSLMFCGVATFDSSPYKAVGLMGWVVDEKGEKMSKSLGNVVWATDAIEKLGADILRLYYCWEVSPWDIQKFSFDTADEIRRTLNILWNCYSFFTTYCTDDFKHRMIKLKVEDRWILSKLNSVIRDVTEHLEKFEFHHVGRKLMDFVVTDLSRFYIKLIRDRVWITKTGDDKLTALSVLYTVLCELSKLFAPITPFISEEIYQNLVRSLDHKSEESVHLSKWPTADETLIDEKLEEQMEFVKKIVETSYSIRQSHKLKLKWPVKQLMILTKNEKTVKIVETFNEILKMMCNAKLVKTLEKEPEGDFGKGEFDGNEILIDLSVDKNLFEERLYRELTRKIQDMRKRYEFVVHQKIVLTLKSDLQIEKILKRYVEYLKEDVGASKVEIGKQKGKYKTELKFEGKKVHIGFDLAS